MSTRCTACIPEDNIDSLDWILLTATDEYAVHDALTQLLNIVEHNICGSSLSALIKPTHQE